MRPVSEDVSKQLIKQIAIAVEYMHSKAVIHRDLNPRNIFLQFEGNSQVGALESAKVKIIDFNSSKCVLPAQHDVFEGS